jgi:hypothetical protein
MLSLDEFEKFFQIGFFATSM